MLGFGGLTVALASTYSYSYIASYQNNIYGNNACTKPQTHLHVLETDMLIVFVYGLHVICNCCLINGFCAMLQNLVIV